MTANRKPALLLAEVLSLFLVTCRPRVTRVVITATPVPTYTPDPTPTDEPKVLVYYEGNTQFELVGPEGTRVLIDVDRPQVLTEPPTKGDILLTTRGDPNHYKPDFVDSFPGQKLTFSTGEIVLPDVRVRSIASYSSPDLPLSPDQPLLPGEGDNYIFAIDIGGLRMVHFGDLGQKWLLQGQLDALGIVDVAMIPLCVRCSQTDLTGFNLLEQINPRIVIPTRASMASLEYGVETWDSYHADPWSRAGETQGVSIGRGDLSYRIKFLVLGEWARALEGHNLPAW